MFNNFEKNQTARSNRKLVGYFFFLFFIFSILSFIFLAKNNQVYFSEISIIFIPKSEKAALNSEQILGNLEKLPQKLSFYQKMIRENNNIENYLSGISPEKIKSEWNNDLKINREGSSSIITFSIAQKNQLEATNFSRALVSTLLNSAAHYYDIKRDIDLRIIEGPIIQSSISNVANLVFFSLFLGLIIVVLLTYFFYWISGISQRDSTPFQEPKTIQKPLSEILEKTITPKKEIQIPEIKKEITEIPQNAAPTKSASAPENLSFIDEDYFRSNIIKSNGITKKKEEIKEVKTPETPKEKKAEDVDFHREPTQEELKNRLNKLLRGEL